MKNLKLLVIGFLITGSFTWAQKVDVPSNVKDTFAQKFPEAKSVKWDKESSTEWEAEFRLNGTEYSANFLEEGTWKETEHEVKKNKVPSKIKKILNTKFSDYKIEEAEISETPEGSVYEFELEKGEQNMEVALENNGNVVKKEMEEDEDKN